MDDPRVEFLSAHLEACALQLRLVASLLHDIAAALPQSGQAFVDIADECERKASKASAAIAKCETEFQISRR